MSDESTAALQPPPLPNPITPAPAKPVAKWRWTIHLTLMAALPVIAGFAGAASKNKGPAIPNDVRALLVVCAFELLFVAIPYGLAWLASRATVDDLLLRWRPTHWVFPLGAIYSVAIRLAMGVVFLVCVGVVLASGKASMDQIKAFIEVHRPQVEKLVDTGAMQWNSAYFWLNATLVSLVVGGLREELWRSSFLAGLRALWPRAFGSQGGSIAAAAVAALFFGVGHLPQGILGASIITVVGFFLGVIMTQHKSIWPAVIAHGLFDATSMALLPIAMEMQKAQHLGG